MKNNLTKEEIISRIGYFRNKRNISAYRLGMELGHAKSYFYKIEKGEISLTVENLLEILDCLGVTTSEFFYDDFENFQRDMAILRLTKDLEDDQLNSLEILLKKH